MPDRLHLDQIELAEYNDWGIYPGPWLFSTHLRVLIVVDGLIDLSTVKFGLGLILDTLRDTSFGWWVRFHVDVAKRDSIGAPTFVTNPGLYGFKYEHFHFDMAGFSLNSYDQVWLFGFNPGNTNGPDTDISQPIQQPLSNAELALLATWMDAGGGVFATGDHDYLGASMCSRIPRVRTMRRWTNAQDVPPIDGPTRRDTNQPANALQAASAEKMEFNLQGDAIPQPIEIAWEPLWDWLPWVQSHAPHPILCSPVGVIDTFPDHPHEGEIIEDGDVQLNLPLNIPGYGGTEYPGLPGGPTPHVIAHGHSTYLQTNRVKGVLNPKRFGLLGVYDGQQAGVGRVVVDSTWHHWFSENLIGFKAANLDQWTRMRYFYRNVGLWLATSAQRTRMLHAASWGIVVGLGPMEFPPTATIWELGGRALDVIGRTASQCTIRQWVGEIFELDRLRELIPVPDPYLARPPSDLLERFALGGVARGLVDVALEYQMQEAQGRRALPDADTIAKGAQAGVVRAQRELVEALDANVAAVSKLRDVLGQAAREVQFAAPDLARRTVRLFVDAVQMIDAMDSALTGDAVDVAIRVVVDGHMVASRVLRRQRIPEPDRRGIVLRLDQQALADVIVWDGSTLEISVAASADASGVEPPQGELRGRAIFTGHPDSWLGEQRARNQAVDRWRLWIRVESDQLRTKPKRRKGGN